MIMALFSVVADSIGIIAGIVGFGTWMQIRRSKSTDDSADD